MPGNTLRQVVPRLFPQSASSAKSDCEHLAKPRSFNRLIDVGCDGWLAATRTGARVDRLAKRLPARSVLFLGIYGEAGHLCQVVADARASRHKVRFAFGSLAAPDAELAPYTLVSNLAGFKWPNMNAVIRALDPASVSEADWVIVVDDDIGIRPPFLDRFLALVEHFEISVAQPALTRMSYPAWRVTRRRPFSLLRETWYAEPQLTALRSYVVTEVLPFSEAYDGFGQDYHWAWLAHEKGWRVAIVDALPMRHESRPYGVQYSMEHSVRQQSRALRERPSLPTSQLELTRSTHRSLRSPRQLR